MCLWIAFWLSLVLSGAQFSYWRLQIEPISAFRRPPLGSFLGFPWPLLGTPNAQPTVAPVRVLMGATVEVTSRGPQMYRNSDLGVPVGLHRAPPGSSGVHLATMGHPIFTTGGCTCKGPHGCNRGGDPPRPKKVPKQTPWRVTWGLFTLFGTLGP